MNNFFNELKRRNVIKETIAYIVVAWVFLQVTTMVLTIFEAPSWVSKTLTFLIAMGLPVWIFFSWAYQVTPEGFKKTERISEDQVITVASNKRLDILIVISLIIAIAVAFINKPSNSITSKTIISKDLASYHSIAVLPFTDYSPSKDQAHITDGMAKNLIQELGKISLLTIPSATTMKTYKETNKTLPEIARELNVDVLLEGFTERRNDRMRITTSLISANDKTLWTQDYEVAMEEFNVLSYNISQKIVKELKLVLSPADSARFTMPALVNPDALEAYLKGMQIIKEGQSFEDIKLAGKYFQKAITLDSTYARSYAHLGFIYNLYPYFSEKSPIEAAKMSEAVNNIALRLDPQLTLAYLNQFKNLYSTEWKWEEALPILSKAESLSLNDPEVLDLFIEYYVTSGKFDKAFSTLEKLGQKKEFRDWYFSNKVYIQFHSRNLEGALRTGEEFQNLYHKELPAPRLHMWALSLLGRHQEAVSTARQILTNEANLIPINRGEIGCVLARAGLKKEALEQLIILKSSKLKYIDPVSIGLLYMGLGDKDLAMQYFEQGYETHAHWMIYLKRAPPFDTMRGDPRFEKLIQKLKFP
ncbi:hypothetical protein V8G56_15165 [Gaetbulibacter aquiaggeris]|uniref:Tetratricopeptide repeat protein n=1 Tax=Gaetbulibacter aquiaggeris TaxID=1735373 RepID=A0ABW7MTD8_9FLAO